MESVKDYKKQKTEQKNLLLLKLLKTAKAASNLLKPTKQSKKNYSRKTKHFWYRISCYRTPKNCYQLIKVHETTKQNKGIYIVKSS